MADLQLGKIFDTPQQRDAIHIAIAPVIAYETLYPGQAIGFVDGGCELVAPVPQLIGIVDPF